MLSLLTANSTFPASVLIEITISIAQSGPITINSRKQCFMMLVHFSSCGNNVLLHVVQL